MKSPGYHSKVAKQVVEIAIEVGEKKGMELLKRQNVI